MTYVLQCDGYRLLIFFLVDIAARALPSCPCWGGLQWIDCTGRNARRQTKMRRRLSGSRLKKTSMLYYHYTEEPREWREEKIGNTVNVSTRACRYIKYIQPHFFPPYDRNSAVVHNKELHTNSRHAYYTHTHTHADIHLYRYTDREREV